MENKNKNEFYGNNYLLAYEYHFAQLEDSTAAADRDAYRALKDKLYYNNDLYQRVYEGLEKNNRLTDVIRLDRSLQYNANSRLAGFNDATGSISIKDGKLTIFYSNNTNKNGAYAISKTSQEFLSFAVSKNQQRLFCSTSNNFIYVFDNRLNKVDSISMGAKITALDFNDAGSIIYFGTSGGYIGYIDYTKDKKNQPVFENKLESEITAVEIFRHARKSESGDDIEETFLLAAGSKCSPRVYKLDDNTLKPDFKLYGNILPYSEKQYGRINQAAFNKESGLVMLVTTTGTYSWNPFTYDLLEKLKVMRRFNPKTEPTKSLIDKPELKFY